MNALVKHNTLELLKYYHAACFSPVLLNWMQAIQQGMFLLWPGLTVDLVCKHFNKLMNTKLGHMQQWQKYVQSTWLQSIGNTPEPELSLEPLWGRTHHVYTNNFDTSKKIYTYLPGRFPILSNIGNRYLFILYDYDINAILSEPI